MISENNADRDISRHLRTLELHLPGWKNRSTPDNLPPPTTTCNPSYPASAEIIWHYRGDSGYLYGTYPDGHYVEMSPRGKLKRIYSLRQIDDALHDIDVYGVPAASRKHNIPQGTLRRWKNQRKNCVFPLALSARVCYLLLFPPRTLGNTPS